MCDNCMVAVMATSAVGPGVEERGDSSACDGAPLSAAVCVGSPAVGEMWPHSMCTRVVWRWASVP